MVRAPCKIPRQIRLANAVCRLVEVAMRGAATLTVHSPVGRHLRSATASMQAARRGRDLFCGEETPIERADPLDRMELVDRVERSQARRNHLRSA